MAVLPGLVSEAVQNQRARPPLPPRHPDTQILARYSPPPARQRLALSWEVCTLQPRPDGLKK